MKHLLLLRHAKSSWDDDALRDHDRPLNGRGRRAARRMGAHLASRHEAPSLVLCSSARRTRETWARLQPALSSMPSVRYEEPLYLADADSLLERIRMLSDADAGDRVLLIGHNPGLERLAARLAREGPEAALQRMAAKFPTAALAAIDLPVERWCDVERGGTLVDFTRPRDLDG